MLYPVIMIQLCAVFSISMVAKCIPQGSLTISNCTGTLRFTTPYHPALDVRAPNGMVFYLCPSLVFVGGTTIRSAYIVYILGQSMDIKTLSPAEIVEKVESGEIPSREFHSFEEYMKAMEA